MSDTPLVGVSRSLLFILIYSFALLVFIILHRLISEHREALFQARYLRIELDVLQAISTGETGPAVEVALKYRSQPKVLTQVLIDLLEMISGRGREILKTIFDHSLREKCLKDLHSRLVVRRLQATRLAGLFSAPPEKAFLVHLLKDKPIIRLAAVHAMVQSPDRESLALVFQAFEQESCPRVHTYTNIIFGAGDKVEPLVKEYLKRPLPVEKLSLLVELAGVIPLPSLYPQLREYADHPEKEVRIKVAKALGKFMIPASYEILEKLAGDKEWEVQAQALKALGSLRNPGALVLLTRGLFSPVWHVRYNARQGLLNLGSQGVRRLEEISTQEVDRFASDMATMALEELSFSQAG
jgi:hypothetical protein